MCESMGVVGGMLSEVWMMMMVMGVRCVGVDVGGVFVEGLMCVGDDVYVIFWKFNCGFTYAVTAEGEVTKKWMFEMLLLDGWGLMLFDGELYVMDVSDKLYVFDVFGWDGAKLKLKRLMIITDDGKVIRFVNELEIIGGDVYVNIFEWLCLVRIDFVNGKVIVWVNLDGLK